MKRPFSVFRHLRMRIAAWGDSENPYFCDRRCKTKCLREFVSTLKANTAQHFVLFEEKLNGLKKRKAWTGLFICRRHICSLIRKPQVKSKLMSDWPKKHQSDVLITAKDTPIITVQEDLCCTIYCFSIDTAVCFFCWLIQKENLHGSHFPWLMLPAKAFPFKTGYVCMWRGLAAWSTCFSDVTTVRRVSRYTQVPVWQL